MDALLASLDARLPAGSDWPARGNVTMDLVAHLLRRRPRCLDGPLRAGLDALCRKVDVLREVRVAYDERWEKATDRRPLPPEDWPGLAAALLSAAELSRAAGAEERGRSLKLLNSAHNAIDLCAQRGSPSPWLDPLRERASRALRETLG
jgi:hypothetical protein